MKKYFSLTLVISLVLSCITFPTHAATNNSGFNLDDYNIIPVYSSAISLNDVEEDKENSISSAYAATRDAISALALKESGYAYIEAACLDELSSWEEQGYELESYSVLIPKAVAAQPTYYGTYHNIDFYTATTSLGNHSVAKETVTRKDIIQAFINGGLNFAFTFAPGGNETVTSLSYAWTIISTIMGWPTTHVVSSNAKLESRANCTITNRAFYTKSLGVYQNVYNVEFGYAHFYLRYVHCNPDWRPSEYIYEGDDYYYNDPVNSEKSTILANAYNVYTNDLPAITSKLSDKIAIKLK